MIFFYHLFALAQNYYYQIMNIDEIGTNDKTAANSSQLQKMLLGTQDVTNEMKKLLITNPNPNATESQSKSQPHAQSPLPPASSSTSSDATIKSDLKPNVSTTSSTSSPATAPPKSEQ